jgi:hypothetical protein
MYRLSHTGRGHRARTRARRVSSILRRPLFIEALEERRLLAVTVVEETFKSPSYTITGSLEGIVDVPSEAYHDEYIGTTSESGVMQYVSPTSGSGPIDLSGSGSGEDTCSPYSYVFEGAGALSDDAGNLSRFNVVFSDFDYTAISVDCPGGGPTAFEEDVSGSFDTSDFTAELTWNVPVADGTSTGSWTGEVVFDEDPFDIEVVSARYVDGKVEVEYVMTGAPAQTVSHSTPVAVVDLYWADGPTEADMLSGPITASMPIYWNQASGRAEITELPGRTGNASHILVVADAANSVAESNESNNMLPILPPYHNALNPLDVDNDMEIVPFDAHQVITELNLNGARQLPLPPPASNLPPTYLDVDGDGWIAPIDALLIINYRNLILNGGEGESPTKAGVVETANEVVLQPIISMGLELDQVTSELKPAGEQGPARALDQVAAVDAAMLEYLLTDPDGDNDLALDLIAPEATNTNLGNLLDAEPE